MGIKGSTIRGGAGKAERRKDDFYATPEGTTRAVLPLLKYLFPKRVWECACGEGHMALELIRAGFDVTATDLVYRGFGEQQDFLNAIEPAAEAIVTNPPFNRLDEFLFHAIVLLGIRDIALVMPMNVWNARSRLDTFYAFMPALVMPMTWRMDTTGEGRPTMSFMWCIWSSRVESIARFLPLRSPEDKPGVFDEEDPLA